MTQNCKGIIGWLCGHNFIGKYNTHKETAYRPEAGVWITEMDVTKLKNHVNTSTYEGDVCTRCGLTVSNDLDFHGSPVALVR